MDIAEVAGFALDPANSILILLSLATALLVTRHARAGAALVVLATLTLVLLAVMPVGEMYIQPLEGRFPRAVLPAHIDGIIVLDGGLHPKTAITRHAPSESVSQLRLVEAAALARRYRTAQESSSPAATCPDPMVTPTRRPQRASSSPT